MAMTLLTTNEETGAASSSFTSSIDSTYKLYIFKLININPATNDAIPQFQVNATDNTSYDDSPITSTFFRAYTEEGTDNTNMVYHAASDLANAASFQFLSSGTGNAADEHVSGTLWLFNPSNTTYVKHFYSTVENTTGGYGSNEFSAGYINDTTAIDDVRFQMSTGNFDGTIKMYGVG